jgi:hypothetical protein
VPQLCETLCATLTHVVSASQAVTCAQQLCFVQVAHAVSPAAAGHALPPPLHWAEHLLDPHEFNPLNAWFCAMHCAQVPAASQPSSQVTQAWSLLHAVASVQHCWARHIAHADVAVMAAQDPPPPVPESEQLLLEDIEPLPIPPPNPPPPAPVQLLLLLLEEHPMTARVTATANVWIKRMTELIGTKFSLVVFNPSRPRSTHEGHRQTADKNSHCGS